MTHLDYRILIVDDETEYQKVFQFILNPKGYDVIACSNGKEALQILEKQSIDLVVTDLKMPGMDGNELIKCIHKTYPEINVMVMTAYGTIESAVTSIKNGAQGYFLKGSNPEMMAVEIEKLYKIKELEISNSILRKEVHTIKPFLRSKNKEFLEVLRMCKKAAESDINVLLLGESGVGKEVLANYIHRESSRKEMHFVPVNCQALTEGLIESELFGHEKGAFTGASERRIGRFETANGGTIFLDEIGDLPLKTQGKLLRSLESRKIERVGSSKSIALDIRVISATNKNLQMAIDNKIFREDLLYRINTLSITIPPLRTRREDLPGLIRYFFNIVEIDQKKKITEIDDGVMNALLNYDYPGNIRELKNIIERLVVLSDEGIIRSNLIHFLGRIQKQDHIDYSLSLKNARANFEKRYIENVIKQNDGNITSASKSLKISTRQLWNKIAELKIEH